MRNVEPGFRVVGSDGNEIGTIANCAREYCEVNTGILGLGHPLYVPMDAIQQTAGNTVFLNIPSDRIGEMDWSHPPETAATASTTGYYGTMPAEHAAEGTPTTGGETTPTAGQSAATAEGRLSPAALETVQPGWMVICSEGKEVGKVAESRPEGLVMERGWFIFQHNVLVPAQAIQQVDEMHHRVYLSVGCAAVNQFRTI